MQLEEKESRMECRKKNEFPPNESVTLKLLKSFELNTRQKWNIQRIKSNDNKNENRNEHVSSENV